MYRDDTQSDGAAACGEDRTRFRALGPGAVVLVFAALIPSLLPGPAAGQAVFTAASVMDSLSGMRERATPLWRSGDPAGLALLDSIATFLEQRSVQDLRRGSVTLQTRVFNLRFEQACAEAIAGNSQAAVRGMKGLYEAGGPPGWSGIIEQACPPLHALRSDSLYQHVLQLWRSEERRWGSGALATPYRDTLSVAERVGGLSTVWSGVKHLLPGFETAPGLDLDSLYMAYLPAVSAEQSTLEYYRLLRRFMAELKDAHTTISFPDSLSRRVYARPPLVTLPVGRRAVVRRVLAQELRDLRIAPGHVIEEIDGIPTARYVETRIAPYVAASTPQDRALRSYGYELLAGDVEQPVRLKLSTPDGDTLEVDVPRSGYGRIDPFQVNTDSILSGNVGYLRLDRFDAEASEFIEEAMGDLVGTDGLIVDLRRNGGGSSAPGYHLLTILVDSAFQGNPSWVRVPHPNARRSGIEPMAVPLPRTTHEPHPSFRFRGPVVLLTSAMTFSAAEDLAAAFVGLERGIVVGQPTGGSTGQPVVLHLPGGGTARVRAKHDTFHGGREFIGQGIRPDILVSPSIEDIASGGDPVLEEALRVLGRR